MPAGQASTQATPCSPARANAYQTPISASRASRTRCRAARSISSSVLAVHHLAGDAKRDLFTRIAQVSDNFVLGDVVVPEHPDEAVIEIDWKYDVPSTVADQLEWLHAAGFDADATYVRPDLAVFRCRRPE